MQDRDLFVAESRDVFVGGCSCGCPGAGLNGAGQNVGGAVGGVAGTVVGSYYGGPAGGAVGGAIGGLLGDLIGGGIEELIGILGGDGCEDKAVPPGSVPGGASTRIGALLCRETIPAAAMQRRPLAPVEGLVVQPEGEIVGQDLVVRFSPFKVSGGWNYHVLEQSVEGGRALVFVQYPYQKGWACRVPGKSGHRWVESGVNALVIRNVRAGEQLVISNGDQPMVELRVLGTDDASAGAAPPTAEGGSGTAPRPEKSGGVAWLVGGGLLAKLLGWF
jgi:hypothetical protein